jgi:hypothetical protein
MSLADLRTAKQELVLGSHINARSEHKHVATLDFMSVGVSKRVCVSELKFQPAQWVPHHAYPLITINKRNAECL